jgi:hypothetical protein
MPPVWLWKVNLHLPGGLPMGQAGDLDTAKADFKVAWKALKARTPSEQLAAAYKAMNIRDDGWPAGRTFERMEVRAGDCGPIDLQTLAFPKAPTYLTRHAEIPV